MASPSEPMPICSATPSATRLDACSRWRSPPEKLCCWVGQIRCVFRLGRPQTMSKKPGWTSAVFGMKGILRLITPMVSSGRLRRS